MCLTTAIQSMYRTGLMTSNQISTPTRYIRFLMNVHAHQSHEWGLLYSSRFFCIASAQGDFSPFCAYASCSASHASNRACDFSMLVCGGSGSFCLCLLSRNKLNPAFAERLYGMFHSPLRINILSRRST